jgi:hypothetical protein
MKKKASKNKKINVRDKDAVESKLEKFAGNPYTSLNGILFIFIIILNLYIYLSRKPVIIKLDDFFLLFLIPVGYFFFGSQLNYFLLSNKRLIVKNHFLFWVNTSYSIDSIAGTSFENVYKRSDALRITTNDNKSNRYSAGSLRSKHWELLRD